MPRVLLRRPAQVSDTQACRASFGPVLLAWSHVRCSQGVPVSRRDVSVRGRMWRPIRSKKRNACDWVNLPYRCCVAAVLAPPSAGLRGGGVVRGVKEELTLHLDVK